MAAATKITNKEKLNAGFKSIVRLLEVTCDKIKLLGDNQELYDEMQFIVKSLLNEEQYIDCATKILALQDSVKNEKSYYLNKTGMSLDNLPENTRLESSANILLETGVTDYNSVSLFTKYMSMIEKCIKEKDFVNNIDECINKLKIATEQQNDLKYELSHISYTLVGYTSEPIPVKPIESVQIDDNRDKIIKLMKKIDDIEKKQAEVCKATSNLKLEQKKMYHGLPPSVEKATIAVQMAEKSMKAVSKKIVEKL